MAQTLNDFYQAAQDYGFSRDYQGRVTGLVINGLEFSIQGQKEKSLLYIKDFTIPGAKRIISTVKYLGADIHSLGPRTYGDSLNWSVTFYSDQNLLLRQWLEGRLIESATNNPNRINYNPVPSNDSYATLDIVNDALEPVSQYKIEGLFIVDIPSVSYDLAGNGKIQEFKVTFGYQRWTNLAQTASPYVRAGAGGGGGGFLGGLIGGLKAVADVANAVRGTANAVRGTASAVRGATTSLRETRRTIRGR